MKRRILLVDDDLAVLLTLKAVLELHGFEVDTATSTGEAFSRLQVASFHLVISDLRMETEEAGLEVIRCAQRQPYHPATALLTAFPPPSAEDTHYAPETNPAEGDSHCLLIKPLGTSDLIRQIEAMLVRHADRQHSDRR